MTSILAHYSEVALKGKNRPWFIGRLVRHLHMALAGLSVKEIRTPMSRIEIVLGREATADEIRDRLSRVFGMANYSVAPRRSAFRRPLARPGPRPGFEGLARPRLEGRSRSR